MTITQIKLSDALYEFSLAQDVPSAALLDSFIQRYPAYAKELTDLAVELVIDSISEETPSPKDDLQSQKDSAVNLTVSRAMSHYQNRLYELQQGKEIKADARFSNGNIPADPFKNMDTAAFRSFSRAINANTAFCMRVRDRQINANTIPERFFMRAAQELRTSQDNFVAYMHLPTAVVRAGQSFKAECKPFAAVKQTYEEAVNASNLSEEQKNDLLSLIEKAPENGQFQPR